MKTIENITIYKCDFCKKELKRKHAMVNHELKCNNNPQNQRPCLNGCKHLEKRPIEYYSGKDEYYSGEPINNSGEAFYCALKEIFIIHPKVDHNERGNNLKWVYFKNEEVEQESMPKECDKFDYGFNF